MKEKKKHTNYKPTFFISLNTHESALIGIKISKRRLLISVFVSSGTGNS